MYDLTLLYVEDDPQAREYYSQGLKQMLKHVVSVGTLTEALQAYNELAPQLLLVDLSLPDGSGLALIEHLRHERSKSIVIILSAHSQKAQLLKAIELGVFRYFIKPIASTELIEAIHLAAEKALATTGALVCLDEKNALFWSREGYYLKIAASKSVALTTHEQRLLELLYDQQGRVVSVEAIQQHVWPDEPPTTQALRNLVARLRKKVPQLNIKSRYGSGYILKI